jgi:hypothetical protein
MRAEAKDNSLRRLEAPPVATQRLLLVAAAERIGEPALVWRAAERLGIVVEATDAAEAEGLLDRTGPMGQTSSS